MVNSDEVVAWLAAGVLQGGGYGIEAQTLDVLSEDAQSGGLDAAVERATTSERRPGSMGMEFVAPILIPVLVEVARQFWAAYQKKVVEQLATGAADMTVEQVKRWFSRPSAKEAVSEKLASLILKVGNERGLPKDDVDALVSATRSDQLFEAFSERST